MNRPTLIVWTAVVIILAVAAFLFYPRAPPQQPVAPMPIPPVVPAAPSQQEIYVTALNTSLQTDTIAACDALTNAEDKSNCKDVYYQRQAMETLDVNSCGQISFTDGRKSCLDAVNKQLALSDPQRCGTIVDKNARRDCYDSAYTAKAAADLSPGLCLNVSTQDRQTACREGVNAAIEEAKVPYNVRYPTQEELAKMVEDSQTIPPDPLSSEGDDPSLYVGDT